LKVNSENSERAAFPLENIIAVKAKGSSWSGICGVFKQFFTFVSTQKFEVHAQKHSLVLQLNVCYGALVMFQHSMQNKI
jgi:hypothetical protein